MRQRLGIAPRAKIRVIRRAAFAKLVGRVAGVSRTNVTVGRNDNRINAKLKFSRLEMKTRKGKSEKSNIWIVAALLHINYVYKFLNLVGKRRGLSLLLHQYRKYQRSIFSHLYGKLFRLNTRPSIFIILT